MDDARVSFRFRNDDFEERSSTVGTDHEHLILIERVVTQRKLKRVHDVDISHPVLARRGDDSGHHCRCRPFDRQPLVDALPKVFSVMAPAIPYWLCDEAREDWLAGSGVEERSRGALRC
ncbi:MAG: hypothetical protein KJ659_04210 [Actinobacteria bacterium]|nr:hypothetical protein [Actinomycetota bacterium]MBU1609621.1 hypothetical protein [Actinomycetota bacterium]MBU2315456.1 hypothetical protein [Actinomycetota bacterium]MBU2384690.1 hypothetical protein [Actinomycetota bacterium]